MANIQWKVKVFGCHGYRCLNMEHGNRGCYGPETTEYSLFLQKILIFTSTYGSLTRKINFMFRIIVECTDQPLATTVAKASIGLVVAMTILFLLQSLIIKDCEPYAL